MLQATMYDVGVTKGEMESMREKGPTARLDEVSPTNRAKLDQIPYLTVVTL